MSHRLQKVVQVKIQNPDPTETTEKTNQTHDVYEITAEIGLRRQKKEGIEETEVDRILDVAMKEKEENAADQTQEIDIMVQLSTSAETMLEEDMTQKAQVILQVTKSTKKIDLAIGVLDPIPEGEPIEIKKIFDVNIQYSYLQYTINMYFEFNK